MAYEQLANRVEIVMWVALLVCALDLVYGLARWRSGGQENVSSGLFGSLGPVLFLLRNVDSHLVWLALVAAYGPIAMWRWRLWRRRRREASAAGLERAGQVPTQLVLIVAGCDVAVAALAIWYIGNPVAVIGTIMLINAVGLIAMLRPSPKRS